MPSNISFPKFKLSCGINGPGGINNCNELKIDNKSSGKPAGNEIEGTGITKASPKLGFGAGGIGKEMSKGEHGHIIYLYTIVI